MRHPDRLAAGISGLLFLGLLWTSGFDVAVRYPESYFLPNRTRNIAVLFGWSAVGCALLAFALHRGLLHSKWWLRLAAASLLVCAATVAWLVRVDARDYPRANFGFVAGSGVGRLLMLALIGLIMPAVLAAVVAAFLRHRTRHSPNCRGDE